jgi:hypothetical protein
MKKGRLLQHVGTLSKATMRESEVRLQLVLDLPLFKTAHR